MLHLIMQLTEKIEKLEDKVDAINSANPRNTKSINNFKKVETYSRKLTFNLINFILINVQ